MQIISKYAIFNLDTKDSKIIEDVSQFLDDKGGDIFNFFEVEIPHEKLVINIISTKQEFDKLFESAWGYSPEKYSRGFAKDGTITYLSMLAYENTSHAYPMEDFDNTLLDYKKTLIHEFVHYVNNLFKKKHNCGHTEKYLSEGLAICLSGQKDNVKSTFDFTPESLLISKDNYNGYYLVTKYLLNNYNKETIFELIKSNRKAREFLTNELFNNAKKYDNS